MGIGTLVNYLEILDNLAELNNFSKFSAVYKEMTMYLDLEQDKEHKLAEAQKLFAEKYSRQPNELLLTRLSR